MDGLGNLYGTTLLGNKNYKGTVFKLSPDGTLVTLHSFEGRDGAVPGSLFMDERGNLYGTTSNGGSNNDGIVFEIKGAVAPNKGYSARPV